MGNPRLVRMGGYVAIITGLMQLAGNALHPPVPTETAEALTMMANSGYWNILHIVLAVSYFLFIPLVIGASAAFRDQSMPHVAVGKVLIFVGAGIGVVQVLTHPTLFKALADRYVTSDAASQQGIILAYDVLWPYNVALEIAHLPAIFIAIVLFGIALLNDPILPRWTAWLGIASGVIAAFGILASKAVFYSDLVFGVSLAPLLIWILAVSVNLLRLPLVTEGSPHE